MKLSDFPCFSSNFLCKKNGVVACGAQNFFANAIGTGNTLSVDAIDEGNDSKT
jgi:hypothetical protein